MSRLRYDVYLAGPFFTEEQKEIMDTAKRILTSNRVVVADPRDFAPIITEMEAPTEEFLKSVYEGNIWAIENSAAVIACLDFKDTGTAFEIGYAAAEAIPVFGFNFTEAKANVMLAFAIQDTLKGKAEFAVWVHNWNQKLIEQEMKYGYTKEKREHAGVDE